MCSSDLGANQKLEAMARDQALELRKLEIAAFEAQTNRLKATGAP